ncbi:restriction endonuclease subunit S [Limnohabitans sp. Rim8]|uniref:restriction endonuclease subunit S n=1 Tax=Limnohabitans sp. Rim8 TaxID=1100718 RepID=UPI0018EE87F2|nr:restriction endonuclease subunit S [Limnohabitans sp. Rim8]
MKKTLENRTLVPRLRFPEFRGTGVWKERALSDVLIEHGNKSTGVEEVFSVSVHKGLVNQIEHLGRSFSALSTDHYNRVLPGDVVYTKSPTGEFPLGVIKQSKLDVAVIVSPLYGIFSPETSALGALLDAYFESPENAYIYLEPLVQKGAKNTININNKKFLSGSLILPIEEAEQKKIADCLASLDKLIALEGQKLVAYKTHKKGLMQLVFPVEGEALPRLRFPEFRDKSEWDEKPLSELAKRCTQKNGQVKSTRVLTNSAEFGVVDQRDFFDKNIANQSNLEGYFVVEKGDYVYNPRISITAPVGPISKNNIAQGVMSPLYTVFRFNNIQNDFYAFYFKATGWHQYMRQTSSTGARHDRIAISNGDFMAMPLPVVNPMEQQKIVDCLLSLDELITAQTQKLAALKIYKKGLMQQLFPVPDEVQH